MSSVNVYLKASFFSIAPDSRSEQGFFFSLDLICVSKHSEDQYQNYRYISITQHASLREIKTF